MAVAFITHPACLLHDMGPGHIEKPDRIVAIINEVKLQAFNEQLDYYEAPLATKEDLSRVHDNDYIEFLFRVSPNKETYEIDFDTAMNAHTLEAALHAAGSVKLAVDLILNHKADQVFCCVRPPGHHAERDKAMGFCFFNNVAVGAAYALEHADINHVAIIDFDVHHGNGTEDIFKEDDRVLLCSSFQSPFYPFSGADTVSRHIFNIPLQAHTDGKVFREAVSKWFNKISTFQPDLIFISAGFDGYVKDAISEWKLTEDDYAWITAEIKKLADSVCKGRIISVLEGGYHLPGLASCVSAHLKALMSL